MRANRSKLFNVRREGIKINSALDTINLHPINEKGTSPLRKENKGTIMKIYPKFVTMLSISSVTAVSNV